MLLIWKPWRKQTVQKFHKSRDTDERSREKLTNNERSFLTSNIQRGGGAYIYPNVQKKWDWITVNGLEKKKSVGNVLRANTWGILVRFKRRIQERGRTILAKGATRLVSML